MDNMTTCFRLLFLQICTNKRKLYDRKTNQTNTFRQSTQTKIKCPYCGSKLTNMTIRKGTHSLRYYVCPRNMNESRFVCDFKGINAQELETSVLTTCQDFFQNQQLYSKINQTIQNNSKPKRHRNQKYTKP